VPYSRKARKIFVEKYGFSEVYGYSFMSSIDYQLTGQIKKAVQLLNPASEEMDLMRTTLVPGLVKAAVANEDRFDSFRIFELGRIYYLAVSPKETESQYRYYETRIEKDKASADIKLGKESAHVEEFFISGLIMPAKVKNQKDENFKCFLELKSHLTDFFGFWNLKAEFASAEDAIYHPGLCINIILNGENIGRAGLLHPKLGKHYGLKKETIIFELNCSSIWRTHAALPVKHSSYSVPSVFPPVFFEFTLVNKNGSSTGAIADLVNASHPEVKHVHLIKTYTGEPLAQNEEALSYRVEFNSVSETLSSKKVAAMQDDIVKQVIEAGFPLRT